MKSLVGYTGFVGSNIAAKGEFDFLYNTKNIADAFGTRPELLVYAGVRAEKFLANKDPDKDLSMIHEAMDIIKKIAPKKLVLISTIDVYKKPYNVNEDTEIDTVDLHPYGLHRYFLEKWVEENMPHSLIVRLPGLYGKNIKKNFIFDLINYIPMLLNEQKFSELVKKEPNLYNYYTKQGNGFYQCNPLTPSEKKELRGMFSTIGFSALNFTDSRGVFQFYNLAYLWDHITTALAHNLTKLNMATEPVSIDELYTFLKNDSFKNEVVNTPPFYDYKTKHDQLFHGKLGYIFNKEFVLSDIKRFIDGEIK